jgi:Zn-finger nucleic acid-binding protein
MPGSKKPDTGWAVCPFCATMMAMDADEFRCPICKLHLEPFVEDTYTCPDNHGVLIAEGHLADEDGQVTQQIEAREGSTLEALPGRGHSISCPHCEALMDRVDYNFTGVIVDVCTRCKYRWVDQDQLAKLEALPMTLTATDAEFFSKLKKSKHK